MEANTNLGEVTRKKVTLEDLLYDEFHLIFKKGYLYELVCLRLTCSTMYAHIKNFCKSPIPLWGAGEAPRKLSEAGNILAEKHLEAHPED